MSDTPPVPVPAPPAEPVSIAAMAADSRQAALIVYVLYFATFISGVTSIVGVIIAYLNRETAPDWLKSHYTFQIRTFWIGLLYAAIAGVLCVVFIGFLLLPAVAVWVILRCALGVSRLLRSEAYPAPESWTI